MAQPMIGEIRLFAGNFPPNGWMFCDGALMPISENDALFTLIGTTYGGDGEETFALPNLQSRVPLHQGTGPDGVNYQLGEMAGTEAETLTIQQIPSHTHPMTATTSDGTELSPSNNMISNGQGATLYITDPPSTPMNAAAITPVGGSQPHENTQPFLCINYIISLFGVFPRFS